MRNLHKVDEQIAKREADCEYYEYDWRFTKQSISRLDDEVMIGEILRKLRALEDIDNVTSD